MARKGVFSRPSRWRPCTQNGGRAHNMAGMGGKNGGGAYKMAATPTTWREWEEKMAAVPSKWRPRPKNGGNGKKENGDHAHRIVGMAKKNGGGGLKMAATPTERREWEKKWRRCLEGGGHAHRMAGNGRKMVATPTKWRERKKKKWRRCPQNGGRTHKWQRGPGNCGKIGVK